MSRSSGQKGWACGVGGGSGFMNVVTKRPYGITNSLILWAEKESRGWTSPYYGTEKQWSERKGKILSGERGTQLYKYGVVEVDQRRANGSVYKKKIPYARTFYVLNLDQTDLKDSPKYVIKPVDENVKPLDVCEKIIVDFKDKPEIQFKNLDRACYSPSKDCVQLPESKFFKSIEEYYATLFHELVHSTGHTARLNRKELMDKDDGWGGTDYSQEELTAELGSAFLNSIAGIDSEKAIENHAAYLKSWLKKLKDDPSLLINAASRAEKAVNYIQFGKKVDKKENVTEQAAA